MPRLISLACDAGEPPARLDAWLARKFPEYSREYLKTLIAEVRARIDGKVPKPSSKLSGGEKTVTLGSPRRQTDRGSPQRTWRSTSVSKMSICWSSISRAECSPIPRAPQPDRLSRECADGALSRLRGNQRRLRPGIVHRLDRGDFGAARGRQERRGAARALGPVQARTVLKHYSHWRTGS